MTPATGTALLILAIFVLPGFITLLFRERLYVVKGEDTPFERLLQALFNSAIIYALVVGGGVLAGLDKSDLHVGLNKSDLSAFYSGDKSLGLYVGIGALLFFVLPIVLAALGSIWASSERLRPWVLGLVGSSESHNTLSGWNELFRKQDTAMIRLTLVDGRVVGGYYGEGSLAGYSQDTQDLYISQRWELDKDGWFVRAAPGSRGIWIPRDSIVSLEVYDANRSAKRSQAKSRGASKSRRKAK
jgi:hypothetical protein